jgi:hypothetical protein
MDPTHLHNSELIAWIEAWSALSSHVQLMLAHLQPPALIVAPMPHRSSA